MKMRMSGKYEEINQSGMLYALGYLGAVYAHDYWRCYGANYGDSSC
jgi:hypothetical protein